LWIVIRSPCEWIGIGAFGLAGDTQRAGLPDDGRGVFQFLHLPSACIGKGVGENFRAAGFAPHPHDPRLPIDFDPSTIVQVDFVVGCNGDGT
jgi:hypothetical protein